MSEFAELEKLLLATTFSPSVRAFHNKAGKWTVQVFSSGKQIIGYNEYRLDTALTLVLQDLRDMANE